MTTPDYDNTTYVTSVENTTYTTTPPLKAGRDLDSQPMPKVNFTSPNMHDLVIADLQEGFLSLRDNASIIEALKKRKEVGIARYGTPLTIHNGRNFTVDLFEELLDAAVYARGFKEEKKESDKVDKSQLDDINDCYRLILDLLFAVNFYVQ